MPKTQFHTLFQLSIENQGGINKACRLISKRLKGKWTWKYLYHVYRGTAQPSKELTRKLNALRLPEPPRKRYRLTVEMDNEAEYKQFKKLTMEQRLCAFREKIESII